MRHWPRSRPPRSTRRPARTSVEAEERWRRELAAETRRAQPLGGMQPHAKPFAGDPAGSSAEQERFDNSRRNFIALVLCLMVGTAGLPHILTRYHDALRARGAAVGDLVLVFILLYLSAPALAVMLKVGVRPLGGFLV